MTLPSHSPVKGNGYDARRVSFRFFPDTANDPTTVYDPNNDVASIVHTSTGLFTVTMAYPVYRVLSATATLQLATVGVVRDVKIGATSTTEGNLGDLAFTVSTTNGASAVDIAADPDNSISVALTLELNPGASG
jgi:archaellin